MSIALRHFGRPALVLSLALVALPLLAQQPPQPPQPPQAPQPPRGPVKPEAQISAMKKLDYMVGSWKGEGWIDMGGRRITFRGSELVQRKLDGVALLVEGSFFARPEGSERDIPVHTTLGVVGFNPEKKAYMFTSWLATGSSGERELQLLPNGWQWSIDHPRGKVRYVMSLTEAGEWLEIGERSSDGAAWTKFFEMKLRKE